MLLTLAGIVAGAIAAISGFGIGSILTPLLAAWLGTKLAVALVSIPHFIGTALRFAVIRQHVNRRVLLEFRHHQRSRRPDSALCCMSGCEAWCLAMSWAYCWSSPESPASRGLASRMRFGRRAGMFAGALSGMFGGLVGNQGGIRSAALLGFDLKRDEFVATATAIALLVDVFRMPVYAVATVQRGNGSVADDRHRDGWRCGRNIVGQVDVEPHPAECVSHDGCLPLCSRWEYGCWCIPGREV